MAVFTHRNGYVREWAESAALRRPERARRCREAIGHWETMVAYCKRYGLSSDPFERLLVEYRAELSELEADQP